MAMAILLATLEALSQALLLVCRRLLVINNAGCHDG
jgi:hypothetical protein